MTTTIDALGDVHNESGRYAGRTYSRPDVILQSSKTEGTFLYPPEHYRDAADFANFWTTAPISDSVLGNIRRGYSDLIEKQLEAVGFLWGEKYDATHDELSHPNPVKRKAALDERSKAFYEMKKEWHKTYPETIPIVAARTIARAGQLYSHSPVLSKDDEKMIEQSTMSVAGEELTVSQIAARYQLSKIRQSFQEPDITVSDRLEDLRRELRRLNGD